MSQQEEISKIFLEAFLKKIMQEVAIKNNISERKRIENIKSKIEVYESRNEFSAPEQNEFQEKEMPIPRPPINNEMIRSMFKVEEPIETPPVAVKKVALLPPRPPVRLQPQVKNNFPTQKQTFFKKKENKSIVNPTRPMVIPNNSPVKDSLTPSIGISVVNEDLTGVPSIDKILQDMEVKTVECPGPNKQVLVYKGGKIQAANLTLTADEINNVMNNFSKKSRIPIGNGFFKAAIDQFLITSVMSEFVGTRFIIQRKPQVPGPQFSQ